MELEEFVSNNWSYAVYQPPFLFEPCQENLNLTLLKPTVEI